MLEPGLGPEPERLVSASDGEERELVRAEDEAVLPEGADSCSAAAGSWVGMRVGRPMRRCLPHPGARGEHSLGAWRTVKQIFLHYHRIASGT